MKRNNAHSCHSHVGRFILRTIWRDEMTKWPIERERESEFVRFFMYFTLLILNHVDFSTEKMQIAKEKTKHGQTYFHTWHDISADIQICKLNLPWKIPRLPKSTRSVHIGSPELMECWNERQNDRMMRRNCHLKFITYFAVGVVAADVRLRCRTAPSSQLMGEFEFFSYRFCDAFANVKISLYRK